MPLHIGEVGVTYGTVVLVAAGGMKPYKWSIQGGALPPGLTLSVGGSATGKPTTVGNFPFVVRVDDSAGGAAGAPSSILVFRQLAFVQTTATCGNSPSDCSPSRSGAVQVNYIGGTPGAKPTVTIVGVTKGTITTPSGTGGCQTPVTSPTTNPPPGMTVSASGGVMTLAAGPADLSKWCYYTATIKFVLVNPNPCGTGLLCVSSNKLSVYFSI